MPLIISVPCFSACCSLLDVLPVLPFTTISVFLVTLLEVLPPSDSIIEWISFRLYGLRVSEPVTQMVLPSNICVCWFWWQIFHVHAVIF